MNASNHEYTYTFGSNDVNRNPLPSNERGYGPYENLNTAISVITEMFDSLQDAPVGLTVAVYENNQLVEYWIANNNNVHTFQKKQSLTWT